MEVKISPQAFIDLEDIKKYIARDNEQTAVKYIGKLLNEAEKIGKNPSLGVYLERKINIPTNYQYWIYRPYLIFYKVENNRINVYRFIHGARNYISVLDLEQ